MSATTFNYSSLYRILKSIPAMFKLFRQPAPTPRVKREYAEITPCGFVPRSYLSFMTKNFDKKRQYVRRDGTSILTFKNGDVIIEACSGHLIVLDRSGRLVLVRLPKDQLAQAPDCPMERGSEIKVSIEGQTRVTKAPGGITVRSDEKGFAVSLAGVDLWNFCSRAA